MKRVSQLNNLSCKVSSRYSILPLKKKLGLGLVHPCQCKVWVLQQFSSYFCLDYLLVTSYLLQVVGLSWGVWDEIIFSLFPQFILGADVLYEASGRCRCIDHLISSGFLYERNRQVKLTILTLFSSTFSVFCPWVLCLPKLLMIYLQRCRSFSKILQDRSSLLLIITEGTEPFNHAPWSDSIDF